MKKKILSNLQVEEDDAEALRMKNVNESCRDEKWEQKMRRVYMLSGSQELERYALPRA